MVKQEGVLVFKFIALDKTQNKASLVAQGYTQVKGIDFDEMFAPVARLKAIRLPLSLTCHLKFKLYQIDIKSVFLNDYLNEEEYVAQPKGLEYQNRPNYVYKLKIALYELKHAPITRYDRLTACARGVDSTLFVKHIRKDFMCIPKIYMYEILFGSDNKKMVNVFVDQTKSKFQMRMMGGKAGER